MASAKMDTEETKISTGEEDETVEFLSRCHSYFYFEEDTYGGEVRKNMWKKRGTGDMKILRDKDGKCRVLMRQDKTKKPVVNFTIIASQKVEGMIGDESKKQCIVSAMDFSDEDKPEHRTIAFRFKEAETVVKFRSAFIAAQAKMYSIDDQETWADLRKLLTRPSGFANCTGQLQHPMAQPPQDLRIDEEDGNGYSKDEFIDAYGDTTKWDASKPAPQPEGVYTHNQATLDILASKKILVVGAGGLGCELLKNLALSGFKQITVIDADTIDLTNLNRQFLFRLKDVNKGKAEVAAAFVKKMVPDIELDMKCCFIQDVKNPDVFYKQFDLVICGLDNIEARKWMSKQLMTNVTFVPNQDVQGTIVDPATIIPMIDGGTEGFKGQTHVIVPFMNADFNERVAEFFPPREAVASCTIATNPRKPEHCVVFAKVKMWPKYAKQMVADGKWEEERKPDSDDREDMMKINEMALAHAKKYNITGIDYNFTMGVVKNIIPAIPCSNAMVSASCVAEAIKILSYGGQTMNNFMMVAGDNYGAVTNIEAGAHHDWVKKINLRGIQMASESDSVERFMELMGQNESLHNLLFQFTEPAIIVDDDTLQEARDDGLQLVSGFVAATEDKSAVFSSDLTYYGVKVAAGMTVQDILDGFLTAAEDDGTSRLSLGQCVLVHSKGKGDFKCYMDNAAVFPATLPLPEGEQLMFIPRLCAETVTQRGVYGLSLGNPSLEAGIVDTTNADTLKMTLKDAAVKVFKKDNMHGVMLDIMERRLPDQRYMVTAWMTENAMTKAFQGLE